MHIAKNKVCIVFVSHFAWSDDLLFIYKMKVGKKAEVHTEKEDITKKK